MCVCVCVCSLASWTRGDWKSGRTIKLSKNHGWIKSGNKVVPIFVSIANYSFMYVSKWERRKFGRKYRGSTILSRRARTSNKNLPPQFLLRNSAEDLSRAVVSTNGRFLHVPRLPWFLHALRENLESLEPKKDFSFFWWFLIS